MTRKELRPSPIGEEEGFYREYCENTSQQWNRILTTRTSEEFVLANRVYQKVVDSYRRRRKG